jgi:GMP synthase (glutamine-hydrolysing)
MRQVEKGVVMKRAWVIRHLAFEDLGSLAPALERHGYAVRYFEAGVDDVSVISHESPELLIVLGGPIGVYETDVYPFLHDELAVIRERLLAELPVLGICLGAQLMAAALGARVYPGHGKEIGWSPLVPVGEMSGHHLLQPLFGTNVQVLHWHGDTFDLPAAATHLASSAMYRNQAFALGRHALALQFHPEVLGRSVERWLIGHAGELSSAKIDVPALRAISAAQAGVLEQAAAQLWDDWLGALA